MFAKNLIADFELFRNCTEAVKETNELPIGKLNWE